MANANMGGSAGGSGRRRSLDAEVNLVPFIDLLSMCICFLLMTAVWTQLGSVQVKQANGTEAAATAAEKTIDLEVKFTNASEASFTLKRAGKVLKQFKANGLTPAELQAKADTELKGVKDSLAKEGLKVNTVMLTPAQSVAYGQLISFMDVLRRNEMVNIGVVPVQPSAGETHASR